MAVDRELRRRVADNLAALLRGEITNFAYVRRLDELREDCAGASLFEATWSVVRDDTGRDNYVLHPDVSVLLLKDCHSEGSISVTPDVWESMRRHLAFLESDFELEEGGSCRLPGCHPRAIVPMLVLLGAATAVWYFMLGLGFWSAAASWVSVLPIGMFCGFVWGRRDEEDAAPFEDVRQWKEHEHLLMRFNLPAYDPAVHHARRVYPWRVFFRENVLNAQGLLLLLLTPLLVAYALVTGPFVVALNFLGSTELNYVTIRDAPFD